MRILFLTASLPYPLASGGAIRTFGILKGLQTAGHEIFLMSFGEGDVSSTPLAEICQMIEIIPPPSRSKIERLKTLITSNQADIETRFYSETFQNRLLELIMEYDFDLIQFEAIEIACYMRIVKKSGSDPGR